nr:immunoglobulin heavy chain junction region [Mus musculus]MBK4188897.1 immunoglobulin heavy chain junction region [Mus musculus]MBK4188898.1 immunoglobulin heavy chain junction region [Mus musculus]MBK4188900.1 immunoglobulin heavy chain junction region [Mus musculus]
CARRGPNWDPYYFDYW